MTLRGKLQELILADRQSAARIVCEPRLIPSPGRYVLAHAGGSQASLATPLFAAQILTDGFITEGGIPESWSPGLELILRGPLGHGFDLPPGARNVALIAFHTSPGCLLSLIDSSLLQQASVTLICEFPPDDLPLSIEVQPLSALEQIWAWADYMAVSAERGSLADLTNTLIKNEPPPAKRGGIIRQAQVMIRSGMPCGGLAECGVCSLPGAHPTRLICKDGPVFNLAEIRLT